MVKAILTKEISVETENKKGTAAKVSQLISKQAQVNIQAAWAAAHNGKGHFSFITDNNDKAMDALRKDYPELKEHEVVVVNVSDAIGDILEVTNKISEAGLNIDYLFTTYMQERPAIVISTDDNKKAYGLFNH